MQVITETLFHVPNVEIKDFNVLIDGKSFFDLSIKIIDMSDNNDYTTGNLLDLAYFKEHYKLIAIDLSKQTKLKDPQQLILLENLKTKIIKQHCFSSLKIRRNNFQFFTKFCKHLIKMEIQKNVNLLNGSDNENSKFATKKWYVIDGQSRRNYSDANPIKFLTDSLESSLCDYSDAYILVTGKILLLQVPTQIQK